MNETSSSLWTRFKLFIRSHIVLISILILAAFVWVFVFSLAVSDFLLESKWYGSGDLNIFGFTLHVEFEGWADYSYFYQTWGERFLDGYTPYTDAFNDAGPEHNAPFFFPPLFLYICALGTALPFGPFGIGFLICLFGYATAFPVYGIAKYLSHNKRVGEIAAASYLLNPLILYHTVYEWLNPAPFVFFMMLSFYLLMKQHRTMGALAMVTAVLFKQIAFFLALPLIAYLIKVPPSKELSDTDQETSEDNELYAGDDLDVLGLLRMTVIVLIFVVVMSLPYILDFSNYFYYIFLKPGMTIIDDITIIPEGNMPMTLAVLLIIAGAPEPLTQFVNLANAYSVFLLISIIVLLYPMLTAVKDDRDLHSYWRRILYLSLLLLLCIHIFSPRGIYKYYCVALIPVVSIASSEKMVTSGIKKIRASLSMVITPLLVTAVILIPSRYIYIGLLVLVLLSYILYKNFGEVYGLMAFDFQRLKSRLFQRSSESVSS
ncbi:MAG: hypothetical protein ACXAC0_08585 [Candidatus Thorarchaeota archaeon]